MTMVSYDVDGTARFLTQLQHYVILRADIIRINRRNAGFLIFPGVTFVVDPQRDYDH